jgi:ADP-heptose:LPS heptosyltransferase
LNPSRIIISRTDSIGDVVLTLPLCNWLRNSFPDAELIYLGRNYTKEVVKSFSLIDQFISWDDIQKIPSSEQIIRFRSLKADTIIHVFPNKDIANLAKRVKIPQRIGTSHRLFHLLTCNHRIDFSRKNSDLHEAQLNFELLRPLGVKVIPTLDDINASISPVEIENNNLSEEFQELLNTNKKIVLLHPKSQGSAREWPIEKYFSLATELVKIGYTVIFTGTDSEGKQFREKIPNHQNIHDSTGKLTLNQLMYLISKSYALVACSTGPLHLAGISQIKTIGLFSNTRPIHPGRWRPIGNCVFTLVYDENCKACKKGKKCKCIEGISTERVLNLVISD